MSKIHGLASKREPNIWFGNMFVESWECFCGRIFYTEEEFQDHVNTYG